MRALVRTLGSLLIVFGAVLWIAKGALAPSPPPPTPVTVAPPSPSKHSSSHGGAHGSAGDVATKGSTAAKVLSSVQMGQASPTLHDFVIHLYKQDGWFDTGIPITADLWLNMRTLDANPGPISDAHWVRGLVGSAIIYPPNDIQGGQEVVTMAASDDHNENAKGSLPV